MADNGVREGSESQLPANPRVVRKPFAVATNKGKIASLGTLESFSLKSRKDDSRVLDVEDSFRQAYDQNDLIAPKYDPGMLKNLLDVNTYHMRACHTKAQDVGGADWEIVDANPDERKEIARRVPPSMQPASPDGTPGAAGGTREAPDAPAGDVGPTPTDMAEIDPEDMFADEPGAKPLGVSYGVVPTDPSTNGHSDTGVPPMHLEADDEFKGEEPEASQPPPALGPLDPLQPLMPPEAGTEAALPDDHTDEHKAVRKQIEAYEVPLVETMYLVWLDYESIGYGCFEIVRDGNVPKADIVDLVHIPAETIRKHRSKERYKQQVGSEQVWYKDVTYEGELDYKTGLPLDRDAPDAPSLFDADMDFMKDLPKGEPSGGWTPPAESFLRGGSHFKESDRRATEVVWIEQPGGIPDIIPAIPALYGDQARTEYNISFFENYGVPSMILLITGDYDPGEEDGDGVSDMEKFLEGRLSELIEEPFSNLVVAIPTEKGMVGDEASPAVKIEAVPLASSITDAGFRLYRQDNRDEVLTANQVDPYRAQVIVEGQLGGSSAGESTEIYKSSTLKPKQTKLEYRLNRFVINDQGTKNPNSKIEFAKLDSRDAQRETVIGQFLFTNAMMTPNEGIENFRDVFNLGGTVEHPAMDLHYLNGKPLDSDDPVPMDVQEKLDQMHSALTSVADPNQPQILPTGEVAPGQDGPSEEDPFYGEHPATNAPAPFGPPKP